MAVPPAARVAAVPLDPQGAAAVCPAGETYDLWMSLRLHSAVMRGAVRAHRGLAHRSQERGGGLRLWVHPRPVHRLNSVVFAGHVF
mgnify:CR=1 FL=1